MPTDFPEIHSKQIQLHKVAKYKCSDISSLYASLFCNEKSFGQKAIKQAPGCFLSEAWMNATLLIADKPTLYTFYANEELLGFCFLGKQKRAYGDIYYLNQTGKPEYDQMWIEQNDIVAKQEYLPALRTALIDHLCTCKNFHRLVISLATTQNWKGEHSFEWSSSKDDVCFVDLSELKQKKQSFLQSLSKNTKSAIKRAAKYIEAQHGVISMSVIQDNIFDTLNKEVAPLHIAQWGATEQGSGFSNPHFLAFHEQLLKHTLSITPLSSSQNLVCELLSFKAGDHPLGYLYMMLFDDCAFFYLSAINYRDKDNKYKPGLVMHQLAIEHYAALNFTKYDFLAGKARYKESLSTSKYPMYTIELSKRSWKNKALYFVNNLLRKSYQLMRPNA
jgi:hypothetical protein